MTAECTPEQGQYWQEQFRAGYRQARSDLLWGQDPRIELLPVPQEVRGECGAGVRGAALARRVAYRLYALLGVRTAQAVRLNCPAGYLVRGGRLTVHTGC